MCVHHTCTRELRKQSRKELQETSNISKGERNNRKKERKNIIFLLAIVQIWGVFSGELVFFLTKYIIFQNKILAGYGNARL